jgi:LmbE family N-acetylglucosaminyl deacetylase
MAAIPAAPLLLVSPHLDDAILSCEALVGRDEPLDVLTVFTGFPDPPQRSWWDAECGFASSSESVATRRREDEAAFAGTPHRRTYLDLLELQYAPRRTQDDRRAVKEAIAGWLRENPAGTVALPAGAGFRPTWRTRLRRVAPSPAQHTDHVFVRDLALDVIRDADSACLLYEELPYVWGGPADEEAAAFAQTLERRLEPVVVPVDRGRKAARFAAYASQVVPLSPDHGRLDEPETYPVEERYWLLAANSSP